MAKNLFNSEKAIKESGLSKREVKRILSEIKKEFPDDQLMYELHVIRALQRPRKAPKVLER